MTIIGYIAAFVAGFYLGALGLALMAASARQPKKKREGVVPPKTEWKVVSWSCRGCQGFGAEEPLGLCPACKALEMTGVQRKRLEDFYDAEMRG